MTAAAGGEWTDDVEMVGVDVVLMVCDDLGNHIIMTLEHLDNDSDSTGPLHKNYQPRYILELEAALQVSAF